MEKVFAIHTELNEKMVGEYVDFQFRMYHTWLLRLILGLKVFGWSIIFLLTIFNPLLEGYIPTSVSLVCIFFSIVFVLGARPVLWYRKRSMQERLLLRHREADITFYEDSILIQDGQLRETLQYDELWQCYETEEVFYLYLNQNKTYILQKKGFYIGELEKFYDYFSEKTNLAIQQIQSFDTISHSSILVNEKGMWIYKILYPDFVLHPLGLKISLFKMQIWYDGNPLTGKSFDLVDDAGRTRVVQLSRKHILLAPVYLNIDGDLFRISRRPSSLETSAYSLLVFFTGFCLFSIFYCYAQCEVILWQMEFAIAAIVLLAASFVYFYVMRNWLLMHYAWIIRWLVAIFGFTAVLLSALFCSVGFGQLIEPFLEAGWKWV